MENSRTWVLHKAAVTNESSILKNVVWKPGKMVPGPWKPMSLRLPLSCSAKQTAAPLT